MQKILQCDYSLVYTNSNESGFRRIFLFGTRFPYLLSIVTLFLRESNREGLLRCKKCEQLIEGPEVDVIFLRPFMEPSSMEISEDGVDVVQNQEEEEGEDLQEA